MPHASHHPRSARARLGRGLALAAAVAALLTATAAPASAASGVVSSGTVTGYTGQVPVDVVLSPDGTRAYVANQGSNSVSVIDTATDTQIAEYPLTLVSGPRGLAIHPTGGVLYVTGSDSDSMAVVNARTGVERSMYFYNERRPSDVAFVPGQSKAYVTSSYNAAGVSAVSVVLTAGDIVTGSVTGFTGVAPQALVVSPDATRAFTADSVSDTVSVIDTATDAQIASIALPAGSSPSSIAVTPDGSILAVALDTSDAVAFIDARTSLLLGTVSAFSGVTPVGLAFSGDSSTLYVSNLGSATVSVVDVASRAESGTVAGFSATTPFGIAVSANGALAYVADATENSISVLRAPVSTVPVPSNSTPTGTVTGEVPAAPEAELAATGPGALLPTGIAAALMLVLGALALSGRRGDVRVR